MRFVTVAMKIKLLAVCIVLALIAPAGSYGGFSDVDADAFYAEPVAWMADRGITNGYAPGCFGPDLSITRGDALVFLWRLEGQPQLGSSPFVDVTAAYQQPAVGWAFNSGITTGTSATTYHPTLPITRGDFVTLLARYAGASGAGLAMPFQDVTRPYQRDAIAWAAGNGISTGTSPTTFHPDRNVTRGEAATLIWRLEGRPSASKAQFDDYCPEGISSLDCVPSSPSAVGWRGAGLSESDLTDRRSGDITIKNDGAVLENFDIDGRIIVEADNVTIRKGRIRGGGSENFAVIHNRGTNLLVEDVEIDGQDRMANGIWDQNYTARRIDIHSLSADAFKAHGNVTIEHVVAHDRNAFAPNAHADAVQIQYGSGIVIRCSKLDWGLPDGYGANDMGRSVSGGQGIWAANSGEGQRIDKLIVENVIVTAAGYVIGLQSETWASFCNVVGISDAGWGVVHPSVQRPRGNLQWDLVVDGATDRAVAAPSGANVTGCS